MSVVRHQIRRPELGRRPRSRQLVCPQRNTPQVEVANAGGVGPLIEEHSRNDCQSIASYKC